MPKKSLHRWIAMAAVIAVVSQPGTSSAFDFGTKHLNQLGRYFGFGWSDGYHSCFGSGCKPLADLPPKSFHQLYGCESCGPMRISQLGSHLRTRGSSCDGPGCDSNQVWPAAHSTPGSYVPDCDLMGCDGQDLFGTSMIERPTMSFGGCDSPGCSTSGCDGGCASIGYTSPSNASSYGYSIPTGYTSGSTVTHSHAYQGQSQYRVNPQQNTQMIQHGMRGPTVAPQPNPAQAPMPPSSNPHSSPSPATSAPNQASPGGDAPQKPNANAVGPYDVRSYTPRMPSASLGNPFGKIKSMVKGMEMPKALRFKQSVPSTPVGYSKQTNSSYSVPSYVTQPVPQKPEPQTTAPSQSAAGQGFSNAFSRSSPNPMFVRQP